MKEKRPHLFVYGTLRKGFELHSFLQKRHVRELGAGTIRAKLFDLGKYPGAMPSSDPRDRVDGEVYELLHPEPQLRELDAVEEFNPLDDEHSLFVRRLTEVKLKNGRRLRAWAYFLPNKPVNARKIMSGDYAEARR